MAVTLTPFLADMPAQGVAERGPQTEGRWPSEDSTRFDGLTSGWGRRAGGRAGGRRPRPRPGPRPGRSAILEGAGVDAPREWGSFVVEGCNRVVSVHALRVTSVEQAEEM